MFGSIVPRMGSLSVPLAAVGLALVVVGPLLAPGFVLAYDMVFVPTHHLSPSLLGLSHALPRSVPAGLLVALLSTAVSGQVLQKLVLVGIFGGAAYGAARLVPSGRRSARIAAGFMYAWNPMMFERLLIGHWALLLGYALLPWVVGAALAFRRGEPGSQWRLALALAAAAAPSPYTGVTGAALALGIALAPPREREGRTTSPLRSAALLAVVAGVNLPWVLPALLHGPVPARPALAQALFRARADSPLGTLGSLVSLGGLWRTDLAPPGRATLAWLPAFAILLAVVVGGWRALARKWPFGAVCGLLGVSAIGVLLAVAAGTPGLRSATLWLAGIVPGGGILRDSQKFVIPLALAEAMGFGMGVDRLLALAPTPRQAKVAAIALPLFPIAMVPTLAWGLGGRLSPVTYPSSWWEVARIVDADPARGAVMVLPWHLYLPFQWNDDRVVQDPLGQFLARPVVQNTALEVGRYRLPAEDPWSRLADPLVRSNGLLARRLPLIGVRYVLVFKEAEWRRWIPRLAGAARTLDRSDLVLYRAPSPARVPRFRHPPTVPVIVGDALTLGLLGVSVVGGLRGSARRGARRARRLG